MIKEYSLTKETKEIKILERFIIDNIRNSELNIEYPWYFLHVKDEADELFVLNTLLDNGEFSISEQQKKLLEQGLEQHYFDENKLYKLPIEDQLYRHYDEVLISIREFKKFIASDDYRNLLENKILSEVELKSIQKSFKQAQANYQKAFQFYALHVNCRSVEPPKEILTKIKNIQAQAYKDREIKDMINNYLKPKYIKLVEQYLIKTVRKDIDVDVLFDSKIDVEYEESVILTITGLYLLKKAVLINRRERYKRAQNLGSFSYTYMPRKKDFKKTFIKTGIKAPLHIKRLDDRINSCNETLKKLTSDEAIPFIRKNILHNFDQWKYETPDPTMPSLYNQVQEHYTPSKRK
ncbi:TPA: hypothetical protein ACIFCT_003238 [Acinetobacter baumannii]|uniref:hypothetical protein n=1 Tax=Acinetobacter baumannii TaxID=470 RepID=UPI00244AAC82|nr:hypothetical protein [Acinetobacter baumannii]MDH2544592.1 hypothetical protein [Acinetobacter baumannii]MDO7473991.1 hypothetical protein [Acinetobacter baumannii]MDV7659599.1 hypothetical protein [Acinetobacter baumannii]